MQIGIDTASTQAIQESEDKVEKLIEASAESYD